MRETGSLVRSKKNIKRNWVAAEGFGRNLRLSKKANAFSAKGGSLRSAPRPLAGPATLAPRKVFFRRTRRRKNDLIFFRRLRAAYLQGAGRIRMAAQLPTATHELCEAFLTHWVAAEGFGRNLSLRRLHKIRPKNLEGRQTICPASPIAFPRRFRYNKSTNPYCGSCNEVLSRTGSTITQPYA